MAITEQRRVLGYIPLERKRVVQDGFQETIRGADIYIRTNKYPFEPPRFVPQFTDVRAEGHSLIFTRLTGGRSSICGHLYEYRKGKISVPTDNPFVTRVFKSKPKK